MPSFEAIVFFSVFFLLAAGGLVLLTALRQASNVPAVAAFESGDFRRAVSAAANAAGNRDSLFAGARAARHLLELDQASALLEALLRRDPDDGEAWLEKGLVAAYARDLDGARSAFDRASSLRADLLESITLHRAWLELFLGEKRLARRLFEEIEQPLANKLDYDLGGGETAFAEWFLHAGWLWRQRGLTEKANRTIAVARRSAPESKLPALLDAWAEDPRFSE